MQKGIDFLNLKTVNISKVKLTLTMREVTRASKVVQGQNFGGKPRPQEI